MNFQDLLNQPLPSSIQESADTENEFNAEEELASIEESVASSIDTFNAEEELAYIESEMFDNDIDADECGIEDCCNEEDDDIEVPVGTDDVDDLDDDVDDFDIDSLSDEELAALDSELGGDSLDNTAGNVDGEEELTPEEEIEADDMMKVAATTMLVNDELNAEEKVALLSNEAEIATVINEGFLTETDVNMLALEAGLVTEAKYNNKMIIKLDAASKKKQLYALAVNVSAAAHNDKDYIKLKKVMKMRKILRTRLEKKYRTEATKRMKIYFKRLRNSKSNTLSNIGTKADK